MAYQRDPYALGHGLPCLLFCFWVGVIVRLVAARTASRVLAGRRTGLCGDSVDGGAVDA